MLINESELPHTRLEFRWTKTDDAEYPWLCDYNLVIELWNLDIRGEVYDDNGELLRREKEKTFSLGQTKNSGGFGGRLDFTRQKIETPFRDSSHMQWDNKRLGGNLPMFAVCDGRAMAIYPSTDPLPADKDLDD